MLCFTTFFADICTVVREREMDSETWIETAAGNLVLSYKREAGILEIAAWLHPCVLALSSTIDTHTYTHNTVTHTNALTYTYMNTHTEHGTLYNCTLMIRYTQANPHCTHVDAHLRKQVLLNAAHCVLFSDSYRERTSGDDGE